MLNVKIICLKNIDILYKCEKLEEKLHLQILLVLNYF